jgi:hypothetical protein
VRRFKLEQALVSRSSSRGLSDFGLGGRLAWVHSGALGGSAAATIASIRCIPSAERARRIPGQALEAPPRVARLKTKSIHTIFICRTNAEPPTSRRSYAWTWSTATSPPSSGGSVSFEAGRANRTGVIGVEHVERSLKSAGLFVMRWQDVTLA